MNVLDVVELMDEESRIRRGKWPQGDYVSIDPSNLNQLLKVELADQNIESYTFSLEDVSADDWEFVGEDVIEEECDE